MPNVFVVYSMRTEKIYTLLLVPIKYTTMYKIINLSNLYISACTFNSIEEAIKDIYNYQANSKNIVITNGLRYKLVKLICKLSRGKLTLNTNKEIWFE